MPHIDIRHGHFCRKITLKIFRNELLTKHWSASHGIHRWKVLCARNRPNRATWLWVPICSSSSSIMDKNAVFFVPKALDPTFHTAITFWLPLVTLITEVLLAWIMIEPLCLPQPWFCVFCKSSNLWTAKECHLSSPFSLTSSRQVDMIRRVGTTRIL